MASLDRRRLVTFFDPFPDVFQGGGVISAFCRAGGGFLDALDFARFLEAIATRRTSSNCSGPTVRLSPFFSGHSPFTRWPFTSVPFLLPKSHPSPNPPRSRSRNGGG